MEEASTENSDEVCWRMAGASALAAHCPRDHDEKLLGKLVTVLKLPVLWVSCGTGLVFSNSCGQFSEPGITILCLFFLIFF